MLGVLALAACAPSKPHWRKTCVASHREQKWVPAMTTVGEFGPKIGTMRLVTRTVCSRYDSTWVVPDTTR